MAVTLATGCAGTQSQSNISGHLDLVTPIVPGNTTLDGAKTINIQHMLQQAIQDVENISLETLNAHVVPILGQAHGVGRIMAPQLDTIAVVAELGVDQCLEKQAALHDVYGGVPLENYSYGKADVNTGKAANGSYTRKRVSLPGTNRIPGTGGKLHATTLTLKPLITQRPAQSEVLVPEGDVGESAAS